MIAKFNGTCKVTGEKIVAGETELVKVNGIWQIKPLVTRSPIGVGHPASKERYSFVHNGFECHVYLYVGAYGHWKVYKIVELATGQEIDLCNKHLMFMNDGSGFRNPAGSSKKECQRYVSGRLDWMLDVDGERTAYETKCAAEEENFW